MKLTIRRKLFLAFLGVLALPLALFAALSVSYVRRERAALDSQFEADAREALARDHREARASQDHIDALLRHLPLDLDVLAEAPPEDAASARSLAALATRSLGPGSAVEAISIYTSQRVLLTLTHGKDGFAPAEQVDPEVARRAPCFKAADVETCLEQSHQLFRPLPGQPADPGSSPLDTVFKWPQLATSTDLDGPVMNIEGVDTEVGYQFLALPRAPKLGLAVRRRLSAFHGPMSLGKAGAVLFVKDGALWPASGCAAGLPIDLPELSRLLADAANYAGVRENAGSTGRALHVYWAPSYELDTDLVRQRVQAVAVIPVAALYAPLWTLQLEVAGAIVASLLLAIGSALLLSGRLVGAVRAVQAGVTSLAKGDWKPVARLSRDELGGELVETVNWAAHRLEERTRLEEVESWRRLVRVMSHEVNNTLAPVRSVAATLRRGVPERLQAADAGEDMAIGLELIVERVDALSGFLGGYAELARLPPPELGDTDLNALVESTWRLVAEAAAAKHVRLDAELEPGLENVRVDGRQMERVLINLFKNAVEASPIAGVVRVRTVRTAGSVELTVEDAGQGVAAEARKNLFVPFYTTKPGGSGIGLALVRQIVLGHGGLVTAEEARSRGALFRVTLPRKA